MCIQGFQNLMYIFFSFVVDLSFSENTTDFMLFLDNETYTTGNDSKYIS